ncbi:hypothetical protein HJFPF1_12985 [Paramyrothecium foliicola]|nr:hypothetical protein HJFPF1_12985 [Paramyrothecium foliicola]
MDSSNDSVYLGVWTNWSSGEVFGRTLTLSRSNGALLIAFLALFVTFVFSQLWRILYFVLFHFHSDGAGKDALHNQRQAVLRNASSPVAAAWTFFQLVNAWNKSRNARPLRRMLPMLIFSLLMAAALTVASTLSSQITAGNEVLIKSPGCGFIDELKFGENASLPNTLGIYQANQIEQAAEYAQRCYGSSPTDCNTFVRNSLPVTTISNASCPFEGGICIDDNSNLILDSGLMDSLLDLGLNTPPDLRFQMQYKLQCAPLVTDKYRTPYKFKGREYVRYQYGDGSDNGSDCNCTMALPVDHWIKSPQEESFFMPTEGYSILYVDTGFGILIASNQRRSLFTEFFNGSVSEDTSTFVPIPELTKHNGDLSMIFLVPNQVYFDEKSQDNWYRATVSSETTITEVGFNENSKSLKTFQPDEPAWPMGCVEQFQLCKQKFCTGLGSLRDTIERIRNGWYSPSNFGDAFYLIFIQSLTNLLNTMGSNAPASRNKAFLNQQIAPVMNEWHSDVRHWFITILAGLQLGLGELARGPRVAHIGLETWITRPNEDEQRRFCESQKLLSADYTSFNLFSLLLILSSGLVIIVGSLTLEPFSTVIEKRWSRGANHYATLEWRVNHPFHMQRLIHDESHEWVVGHWDIPITMEGSKSAALNLVTTGGLPRFCKPIKHESKDEMQF